ncbi:MAG: TIGR02452 family protein, partial [Lachnospiraceae bacterium]|nr:TIGR02452 family protein [Lachnospiraceae bacterium]
MRNDNIEVLQDTLRILKQGSYKINGRTVDLKLSKKAMETIHVLLPENVQDICNRTDFEKVYVIGRCGHGCENKDSFAAARQQYNEFSYMFGKDAKPVLVLNLANPVHPGGGARSGARAQEEDLCRKSSLLLSLESSHAAKYYEYNKNLNSYMGSEAMMFTPEVEIIRDENGNLLEETVIVAVLTCAAPMITQGREGMSENDYQDMVYNRIMGMLKCAAYFGYKNLVLGAWGCGAFGNDAHVMSDLFYKALKEMKFNGLSEKDFFRRIDFAVLDRTDGQYNFKEFYRNFAYDNFFKEENEKEINAALQRIKETEAYLDKVRGSLFGGAVGDALGYPVEFLDEEKIFSRYGENGIREYELDPASEKALISDDTQMTLFTANGILMADTRGAMRGIGGIPHVYIPMSYLDWLRTQEMTFEDSRKRPRGYKDRCISWLADVPELYSRRAPGRTCLSALDQYKHDKSPQNNRKDCGGIMRVDP